MYSYIIGKVISKSKNILILENNNIGYEIYMTEIALSELNIGEDAKIYTYYNVTQDNISLFGFKNLEEKKMFENLISVSKIGAKTAIGILSSISTAELAISIITNDINRLSKLPGIGKKTAQRLVLEVIDKVKTEEIIFTEEEQDKRYKALKEVSVVLDYTDPTLRAKVPKNFIWFMEKFKDETHYFKIDLRKGLKDQNLMYESVVILSIILKSSWCDKKTINNLKKNHKVNEQEFLEDRRQRARQLDRQINGLMVTKKEGFFKRMIKSIKKFFGFNKNRLYIPD